MGAMRRGRGGVPIPIVLILLLAVAGGTWWFSTQYGKVPDPVHEENVESAVSDSASDSVQAPATAALSEKVTVSSPVRGATVGKSFKVAGKAPGTWFFEAQFPIQVRSDAGDVIGRGVAHAQGEWMTEALVPFTAEVTIDDASYKGAARLILLRDNPSGLPENDDAVEFPIVIR